MDWLWQGLLVGWVQLLIAAVVGIFVAYLKKKGLAWATPALYGLGAFAFVALIFACFSFVTSLRGDKTVQMTPENSETLVRTWLDDLNLDVRQMSAVEAPESIWGVIVTFPNGHPLELRRRKDLERFLTFQANVVVSPDDQAVWNNKMTQQTRVQFIGELAVELAKEKFSFQATLPNFITTVKRIPINGLS